MNELQIKVAGSCWGGGMDTLAIARRLNLPEPVIYNNLHRIKVEARK